MSVRPLASWVVGAQVDDAYLGGERNGGKPGRGSENKRPLVVAVDTDDEGHPGMAVIEPVPGFTTAAFKVGYNDRLEKDAEVYSDGLGAFRAAIDLGHPSSTVTAISR